VVPIFTAVTKNFHSSHWRLE